MDLDRFVVDFATGLQAADARRPQAVNVRSKERFQPGLGPHSESRAVDLIVRELEAANPVAYRDRITLGVPYPETPRQKCDLCLGSTGRWEWAIEVKMLRFLGDNGKLNDNILMHILSPYPEHRSAVTDCLKLTKTNLGERHAVLIYGFEHEAWPLEPALRAFEVLASGFVTLGRQESAHFGPLVHPVHKRGTVAGWEVLGTKGAA